MMFVWMFYITGMRAGAFVIQKFQLFKQIHTDKNCDKVVPFIIKLLNDKIRSLVKVSCPKTFEDLRDIIRRLEEDSTSRNKPNIDEGSVWKCYKCGGPGHMRNNVQMQKTKAGPFWIGV